MLLKLKKNRKGFTLIELIVVVAIIAILAAIAVPNFIGMQKRAELGVYTANASAWCGAINVYNAAINGTDGLILTTGDAKTDLSAAGMTPAFQGKDSDGSLGLLMVKFKAPEGDSTESVAYVDTSVDPTKVTPPTP